MSLEIQQREREGITLLDLIGRITVGEAASTLRAHLHQLDAAGVCNLILNLAQVDYIDSTGLGVLVVGFTSLRNRGGRLKLVNLTPRNIELLVLTKLTTVFEVFNDEQDAVNSFFPDREIKRFDILNFVKEHAGE